MDWKSLVKDQEESGKSVAEYCGERGIRPNSFYAQRSKHKSLVPQFARVETESRVNLELENGVKLKVALPDLKAVLSALE